MIYYYQTNLPILRISCLYLSLKLILTLNHKSIRGKKIGKLYIVFPDIYLLTVCFSVLYCLFEKKKKKLEQFTFTVRKFSTFTLTV